MNIRKIALIGLASVCLMVGALGRPPFLEGQPSVTRRSSGLTAGTYLTNLTFGSSGTIDSNTAASFGTIFLVTGTGNGSWRLAASSTSCWITAATVSTSAQGTCDTGFARNAAGIVEVNNGTAGTQRSLIAAVVTGARTLPTYGTTVNIDASLAELYEIVVTNGTGFTVANPTSPRQAGQQITIKIKNTSGGAAGALTWGSAYKTGAAWTQPATGNSRSISFYYDGTNWVETYRAAADVAN